MYFDNFTYSDGTEFELRVDDVVIVVVVVDFLPHLDLFFFRLAVLTLKCFENCKKRSFSVIFFWLFSYFFLQSSIRLQLHTETKRSILNHSFYSIEACVFVYG